jgi:hypothetical protein
MKKTNYIKHPILYNFIWFIFLSLFLFPFPSSISQAADTPTFEITSPSNDKYFSDNEVNFSGTFTLGTNTELTATAVDSTVPNDEPTNLTIDSENNLWTVNKKNINNPGWHKITFNATFKDTVNSTETITKSIWIMITADRPVVTDFTLTSPNNVGNQTPWVDTHITDEDITHVPLDAQIKIKVHSNNGLKFKTTKPIIVKSGSQPIESIELYQDPPTEPSGDYMITFPPNDENPEWLPNTTYQVDITTDIVDNNSNPIYPKVFKFTTTSTIENLIINEDGSINDSGNENNPHGNYSNKTNTCAFCHSTHNGINSSLEGGLYFDSNPTKSYCLSCHDGTMNAPIVNNFENTQHNHPDNTVENDSSQSAIKQTDSCTACHNPHTSWTKNNPNMLKNHTIYTSTVDNTKKDSLDVPCESCHGDNAELENYQHSDSKDLHYKKSSAAIGNKTAKETDESNFTIEDYSLCLRCHNTIKKNNAADIETLYLKDKSKSGHFIALPDPDSKLTQNDGSKLNGPIPCAECHETHGSSNIKLLKSKLGHENQESDFSVTSGEWNADREKEFCLKCHGTSQTSLYGVYSKPINVNHDFDTETGKNEPCAKCHSNSYNPDKPMDGFIEAAHAPQRKQQAP